MFPERAGQLNVEHAKLDSNGLCGPLSLMSTLKRKNVLLFITAQYTDT